MSQRRASLLSACFLPLVALLILLIAYTGLTLKNLPARAEQRFGPPRSDLEGLQRYTLIVQLLWHAENLDQPFDPSGTEQLFSIQLGESTGAIIKRLEQQGLIASQQAMRLYLQYSGLDRTIQAGNYTLSPAMTAIEIAHQLQDATPGQVTFTVLAGWRMEEIAASLPTSGLTISEADFLKAAYSRPGEYSFISDLPPWAALEGFFFPGSYELPREILVSVLIETLLTRFDEQVTPELQAGFINQGLTLYQAVILASIIEREAILDDEMPLIASVFLNRLAIGMKLDADPTVQYAIGLNITQNTWWTNPLSAADLKFDSPYNTYLYPGLPPGPIANPGLSALRAVAFPAQTPYYYFRALCDGSHRHVFAITYQEHIDNACP